MRFLNAYGAAWLVFLGIRQANDDWTRIEANLTVAGGNLILVACALVVAIILRLT